MARSTQGPKPRPVPRSTVSARRAARVVSLTHPLHEAIPVWPGDPYPSVEPVASYAANGFLLQRITLGEHSGTHLVAPRTYAARGASVDELPARMFILPALLIDKTRTARLNSDYLLTRLDVLSWERRHGRIPRGALVVMSTGWAARWPDPDRFLNQDRVGRMHFPGFSLEAVECLVDERGIAGLGIDTHGVDGGLDASFAASRKALDRPRVVLENLANLGRLPPRGALVFVGALPIVGGSGSPATVLALIP